MFANDLATLPARVCTGPTSRPAPPSRYGSPAGLPPSSTIPAASTPSFSGRATTANAPRTGRRRPFCSPEISLLSVRYRRGSKRCSATFGSWLSVSRGGPTRSGPAWRAAELDNLLPFDEPYSIPAAIAAAIRGTRGRGGRIVAIGTTVARALEAGAPDRNRAGRKRRSDRRNRFRHETPNRRCAPHRRARTRHQPPRARGVEVRPGSRAW